MFLWDGFMIQEESMPIHLAMTARQSSVMILATAALILVMLADRTQSGKDTVSAEAGVPDRTENRAARVAHDRAPKPVKPIGGIAKRQMAEDGTPAYAYQRYRKTEERITVEGSGRRITEFRAVDVWALDAQPGQQQLEEDSQAPAAAVPGWPARAASPI